MVIEEQKDTMESNETSLDKQKEDIKEVPEAENGLEEFVENKDKANTLEKKSESLQGINESEQEEGALESDEEEVKENVEKINPAKIINDTNFKLIPDIKIITTQQKPINNVCPKSG